MGSSYKASFNLTILECGFEVGHSFFNAYISGKEFTYSLDLKWFFMHLIATYLPVFKFFA